GIQQERNQDNPVFPKIHRDVQLADEEAAGKEEGGKAFRPERSQVVHAQENAFWVLMQGRLHKYLLTIDRAKGAQLVQQWRQQMPLGSPLHDSQVWRQVLAPVPGQVGGDDGEEILMVVTQASAG